MEREARGFAWQPAGDRAALVGWRGETGPAAVAALRALAEVLESDPVPGLGETVPGAVTLLVYYDPLILPWERLEERLRRAAEAAVGRAAAGPAPGNLVEVPVLYGGEAGPDLAEAASLAGLSPEAFASAHASCEYAVRFLGFAPGFAYLGPVPEALRVPRLERPRTAVPAGSVAVAGEHTAVYPGGTPGGWRVIGRTPLTVYNPRREPRCLFRPGDRVRFRPMSPEEFRRAAAAAAATGTAPPPPAAGAPLPPAASAPGDPLTVPAGRPEASCRRPALLVLRAGSQATVQDLGRFGFQKEGVPVAGAVDAFSLVLANRLAGNPPGAAALEVVLMGLELEALARGVAALAGADLGARLNGRPVPPGTSFALAPGDRLAFAGGTRGCRAYLAVAGGIDVPEVLGSRSTDLLGRLGGVEGRPLRAGDVLCAGEPSAALDDLAGRRLQPGVAPEYGPDVAVRALLGPQAEWFSRDAVARFFSHVYRVSPASDRMGVRLDGTPVSPEGARELPSEGTPPGSVQVPAGGQPIVLLAGCQTLGGYPRIAAVITADLPVLAQARPGFTQVRFRACSLEEAHAALAEQARLLADPGLVV